MLKKIILIQVDSILGYPPTMALINELVNVGTEVTVLTTVVNNQLIEVLPGSVIIQKVGKDYTYNMSPIIKLRDLFAIRKNIWNYIDAHYDDDYVIPNILADCKHCN